MTWWLQDGFPLARIAAGRLEASIFLPDATRGFYRSTRFDWSGMVGRVVCGRHTYFAPWRLPHDPTCYEHGIGTAEEFGLEGDPPAWGQAPAGGRFMKIGVGLLNKLPCHQREYDDAGYSFREGYPIALPGTWNIVGGTDWIEFDQSLADELGHAYRYTKRLEATDGVEPSLIIRRTLANTGAEPLCTEHYGHNFVVIDDQPVDAAYEVQLPFECPPASIGAGVRVEGRRIVFPASMPPGEPAWARLSGFDRTRAEHNRGKVLNNRTGGFVAFATDAPPCRYNFFAESTATCPEGFVRIDLAPGRQRTWTTTYTFGA